MHKDIIQTETETKEIKNIWSLEKYRIIKYEEFKRERFLLLLFKDVQEQVIITL